MSSNSPASPSETMGRSVSRIPFCGAVSHRFSSLGALMADAVAGNRRAAAIDKPRKTHDIRFESIWPTRQFVVMAFANEGNGDQGCRHD